MIFLAHKQSAQLGEFSLAAHQVFFNKPAEFLKFAISTGRKTKVLTVNINLTYFGARTVDEIGV
ncbi:MAG: hypothetical protein ACTSYM_00595 [Candidatus Baldrarchaeia archaeon]